MDVQKNWKVAVKLDFDSTIDRINRMTDRNLHSEALVLGAELLGARALRDKLQLVAKLHDLEGSMPPQLKGYRDYLYDSMMTLAKRQLDPEEFKRFYNAF